MGTKSSIESGGRGYLTNSKNRSRSFHFQGSRSFYPKTVEITQPTRSQEKQHRYGTCSISQERRGPSNGLSKMNLFMAGGHSF